MYISRTAIIILDQAKDTPNGVTASRRYNYTLRALAKRKLITYSKHNLINKIKFHGAYLVNITEKGIKYITDYRK